MALYLVANGRLMTQNTNIDLYGGRNAKFHTLASQFDHEYIIDQKVAAIGGLVK
jgi:hypothetical protein